MKRNRWLTVGIVGLVGILAACGNSGRVVNGYTIEEEADLSGADLRGADLSGADLSGADLTNAILFRADLRDADLTNANLTNAILSGADLRKADLTNAILFRADLRDADLTNANLRGAKLRDASWDENTIWPNGFTPPTTTTTVPVPRLTTTTTTYVPPPTTPTSTVPTLDTGATPTSACLAIFRAVVAASRVDEFFDRLYLKSTDDCLDVNDWLVTAVRYPEVIGGARSAAALARELAILCGKKPASRVCMDPRTQNIITNFGP